MAWWVWLIIWTVLVLGLFGMLAAVGFRLYRKFRGALAALEELTDKVAALNENVEQLAPEPAERAITVGYAEVSRRHDIRRERRSESREGRREARLAGGKLLLRPTSLPTLRK
jgi:hypothetical protein